MYGLFVNSDPKDMIRYNTKRMEKDRIRRNQIDFIYKRNTRRYVTRDGGCG